MYFLLLLSALLACAAGVPLENAEPRLDGRIVGGILPPINNHPWKVSLRRSNSHICGGAIINARWIVTAAHCISGTTVTPFSVRSGFTNFNSGGTIHSATRIIVHPNYNSRTLDFDVAIVQVSPAFVFSNVRQPIPLISGNVAVGTNAIVTGRTRTSEVCVLTVQIISDASCNSAFGGIINPRMICAVVIGGDIIACQIDSGNPLVARNTLVGIASWVVGSSRPQLTLRFTRASVVRTWIINNAT